VVHRQITVKKNDSAGTVLHCPAGSIVTGGGWETEYVDVRVYASYPDLPGWSVMAYNRDSSDHPLHVYAVCVSGTGGVTTASTRMYPIPSGAGGNMSVACPSKALMTSGGFVAGTRGDLMVYLNGPKGTDNEWRVFTLNTAATVKDLSVYVTCLGFP
jgi:hypothetical protein